MSPRDTPDNNKGKDPRERAKGVPGRGEDNNVTYVNFGKRRKVETEEETLRDDAHPSTFARAPRSERPHTDRPHAERAPAERPRTPEMPGSKIRETAKKTGLDYNNSHQTSSSKSITSQKTHDSIFILA